MTVVVINMQGKVTEILDKRQEIVVDSKIYPVLDRAWEFAAKLKVGDMIDFSTIARKSGDGTEQVISFFKKIGKVNEYTPPIYRQKGRYYSDRNEDAILRESVLRSAVMYMQCDKVDIPKLDLKGLFGIAALMEKGVREGFDKVMSDE